MELLNNIMKKEVNKYVNKNKGDLIFDIHTITARTIYSINVEYVQNDNLNEKYIWLLRKNGTNLLVKSRVYIENSSEREVFDYYVDNTDIVSIYEVVVNRIDKDDNIFGTITKISLREFRKEVMKNTKKLSKVVSKVYLESGDEPIFVESDNFDDIDKNIRKELLIRNINYERLQSVVNFTY